MRALAAALVFLMLLGAAPVLATDPPVPPGRDMGGMPVALVGSGVDYTEDGLAQRLARDGEGEITGYDFIDDDRRPFAPGHLTAGTIMAAIVLNEGQTTSIVAVRAALDNEISLGRALLFAGRSPARIIVVEGAPREQKAVATLASAVRYFHDRLFVMAAGDDGRDLDQGFTAALRGLPNLIVTAAVKDDGSPYPGANAGALAIDVATSGAAMHGVDPCGGAAAAKVLDVSPGPSACAAGHIAALAARLSAVEPGIPATALKVRIGELAERPTDPGALPTVLGVIRRPQRYFWLE